MPLDATTNCVRKNWGRFLTCFENGTLERKCIKENRIRHFKIYLHAYFVPTQKLKFCLGHQIKQKEKKSSGNISTTRPVIDAAFVNGHNRTFLPLSTMKWLKLIVRRFNSLEIAFMAHDRNKRLIYSRPHHILIFVAPPLYVGFLPNRTLFCLLHRTKTRNIQQNKSVQHCSHGRRAPMGNSKNRQQPCSLKSKDPGEDPGKLRYPRTNKKTHTQNKRSEYKAIYFTEVRRNYVAWKHVRCA